MASTTRQDRGLGSTASTFVKDLIAGGVSGVVAKTIGAPIERVKLLLQTQTINSGLTVQYRNPIDCTVRIYRNEGLLSFWRGNLANVYRYFPSQAMNFAFKGSYSEFFTRMAAGDGSLTALERKHRRMVVSLASGGLAGATALAVTYPFDVARTRLAVDVCTKPAHATNSSSSHPSKGRGSTPHGGTRSFSTGTGMGTVTERQSGGNSCSSSNTVRSVSTAAPSTSTNVSTGSGSGKPPQGSNRAYSGTFDCLRVTYQLEGLRGVYAGFGVSLLGVIVFRALYLGGYDIVKEHYQLEHASRTTRFVAAQIVTTAVGTLCFPIDTVKRRLMVQSSVAAPVTSPTSLGAMHQGIPTASTSIATPAAVTAVPPVELSVRKRPLRVPYKSGWDCARRIIAEEGVRGLFVGLSVNLVRGFSGAVLLVAYDDLKRYL